MSATPENTTLQTNTSANATSKNPISVLKESFKVWKYARYCHKRSFTKKINQTKWNKTPPFKLLNQLIASTKKLHQLWEKIKTKKAKTPVQMTLAVNKQIKNIILTRDNWTRKPDAIITLESYISLSKTTTEIFEKLFTEKELLLKI